MNSAVPNEELVENEVDSRQRNEDVQAGFEAIKQIAAEDGQEHLIQHDDQPLHFYCECAKDTCQERIVIEPSLYERIHKRRNRFILLPEHLEPKVDKVVDKHSHYWIVEKPQLTT